MSNVTEKLRVLVVDDSVTMRRLLSDCFGADPEIEVVGTAPNGRIALAKITQSPPDIVTLDVEMPELDGLQTLVEIRKTHPKLPVVMFSALTERAAHTTLEALAKGATDYFAKPTGQSSATASMRMIREEIVPRLKTIARRGKPRTPNVPVGASTPPASPSRPPTTNSGQHPAVRISARPAPPARPSFMSLPMARASILAIGASTGGPNAIADVLARLRKLPVPIVITQHMPPLFTRLFAQRLDTSTVHRVREAVDGDVLEPGLALIAPGEWHMTLRREGTKTVVRLNQEPPENSCRPAVDPMLRSVAQLYGQNALAVILTGMGQDGLRGCESIRAAGGQVVAQDEATSVVWGMPGFVARANLAHAVVPLDSVAAQIESRLQRAPVASAHEESHVSR